MSLFKRVVVAVALAAGLGAAAAPQVADAGIFYRRVAPVRRAVLPPYPVARRVAFGPVYRPFRPYRAFYGPGFYGPGVTVGIGVY